MSTVVVHKKTEIHKDFISNSTKIKLVSRLLAQNLIWWGLNKRTGFGKFFKKGPVN